MRLACPTCDRSKTCTARLCALVLASCSSRDAPPPLGRDASAVVDSGLVRPIDGGALDAPEALDAATPDASPPVETLELVEVAAGREHTCARSADGAVLCWGANESGQLGDGTVENRAVPTRVIGVDDAAGIATGGRRTCAWNASGELWCWGAAPVGDGTTEPRSTPTGVRMPAPVAGVAIGMEHACALDGVGHPYCWGRATELQLGVWATRDRELLPVMAEVPRALEIAAGRFHTCASLVPLGRVSCWGASAEGRLGDGVRRLADWPHELLSLEGVLGVRAGADHTCALLDGGAARCWGVNARGQLGDGTTQWTATPVAPRGLPPIRDLATGTQHTCAALADGRVACFGDGTSGQLGIPASTEPTTALVMVAGVVGALDVAAGGAHTCALTAAGSVFCWGAGADGQLGGGAWNDSHVPVEARVVP